MASLKKQILDTLKQDLREAVNEGVKASKEAAPVKTGRLKRNIHAERSRRGVGRAIVSPVHYSRFQERRFRFMRAGLRAALASLRRKGYR